MHKAEIWIQTESVAPFNFHSEVEGEGDKQMITKLVESGVVQDGHRVLVMFRGLGRSQKSAGMYQIDTTPSIDLL